METRPTHLNVTYFPFTVVEENDLKRLILYFDGIHLLQVTPGFDPGLPPSVDTAQSVQLFCPLTGSHLLESIERAHRSYRQLGSVHQDGGLTEVMRSLAFKEDHESSRTRMVAYLRQGQTSFTTEEIEVVNDAVFLLLAHQFDLEHSELAVQLNRIRGLEAELHREVGIESAEEGGSVLVEPQLLTESDHSRTWYSLERLRAWTRLYCNQEYTDYLLPLTTCIETIGEIIERLPPHTALDKAEPPAQSPAKCPLAMLPDPHLLPLDEILELRHLLGREGALAGWREAVAAAMRRLHRGKVTESTCLELRESLQGAVKVFQQLWPGDRPSQFLQLTGLAFPAMGPERAFAMAAGLETPGPEKAYPEGPNGITLLLAPAAVEA